VHLHPRVDLPDGNYTCVPKRGDRGVDTEMHDVAVEQDLDQSPEGPKANLASKGKPWIINPVFFKIMHLPLLCLCIYVSRVELKP
jgi:hypothetical protein